MLFDVRNHLSVASSRGTKLAYRLAAVEQMNVYLRLLAKPHKKEKLLVSNNVLKLACKLLKVRPSVCLKCVASEAAERSEFADVCVFLLSPAGAELAQQGVGLDHEPAPVQPHARGGLIRLLVHGLGLLRLQAETLEAQGVGSRRRTSAE